MEMERGMGVKEREKENQRDRHEMKREVDRDIGRETVGSGPLLGQQLALESAPCPPV